MMLDGFTVTYSDSAYHLWCSACASSDVFETEVFEYFGTPGLPALVRDAREHYAAKHAVNPLPRVRYGVFESDDGDGIRFYVWDRVEQRRASFVYTHEADAQAEAVDMNKLDEPGKETSTST